jgi:hypothetical protein
MASHSYAGRRSMPPYARNAAGPRAMSRRAAGEKCSRLLLRMNDVDGQYVAQLFKWIKQHLRIKTFLGTSKNAVKTQIWCAVPTYVLIAIVKKELQLDASLYTLLQILSVSLFEKNQLSCALRPDVSTIEASPSANQLILFEF